MSGKRRSHRLWQARPAAVAALAAVLLLSGLLLSWGARSGAAWAHEAGRHQSAAPQALALSPEGDRGDEVPAAFPVKIGGSFELVDHFGNPRRSGDFGGAYQLIFFGYARCDSICPVALRAMLDASDRLAAAGHAVQPLLITVDPEGEPPAVLKEAVEAVHPRLLGLTGTVEQIAAVEKAFHVDAEFVGSNIKGDKVFAHGSYIYLMAPDGEFLTLLPPILDAETMAAKMRAYL
jgi:protein SCO1/2